MGMRNILALTGDYSDRGFGGQGMPVFDMDSTSLVCFLKMLEERNRRESGPDETFCTGCAVSPFKSTEAETFADRIANRCTGLVKRPVRLLQRGDAFKIGS
ncbi:MAG: hypothetical protein WAK57_10465 [Desulfobacterales bacterium]